MLLPVVQAPRRRFRSPRLTNSDLPPELVLSGLAYTVGFQHSSLLELHAFLLHPLHMKTALVVSVS